MLFRISPHSSPYLTILRPGSANSFSLCSSWQIWSGYTTAAVLWLKIHVLFLSPSILYTTLFAAQPLYQYIIEPLFSRIFVLVCRPLTHNYVFRIRRIGLDHLFPSRYQNSYSWTFVAVLAVSDTTSADFPSQFYRYRIHEEPVSYLFGNSPH